MPSCKYESLIIVIPDALTVIENQWIIGVSGIGLFDLSKTQIKTMDAGTCRDFSQIRIVLLPPSLERIDCDCLGASALTQLDLSGTAVERVGDSFCRDCKAVARGATASQIEDGRCGFSEWFIRDSPSSLGATASPRSSLWRHRKRKIRPAFAFLAPAPRTYHTARLLQPRRAVGVVVPAWGKCGIIRGSLRGRGRGGVSPGEPNGGLEGCLGGVEGQKVADECSQTGWECQVKSDTAVMSLAGTICVWGCGRPAASPLGAGDVVGPTIVCDARLATCPSHSRLSRVRRGGAHGAGGGGDHWGGKGRASRDGVRGRGNDPLHGRCHVVTFQSDREGRRGTA
jgi:hypothetical protein